MASCKACNGLLLLLALLASVLHETAAFGAVATTTTTTQGPDNGEKKIWPRHRNAYATMMYMGTPRDYEFYVATRVLLRSLASLRVDADLVVIASMDVPLRWVRAMEKEDGARVVRVENVNNPYKDQHNFDKRFKLTLNKLYAWSLVDYDRVVMLDADNLFLRNTDELFQCGQFCAAFINPCIFHTGLFVLQPSNEVFKDMLHQLEVGKDNPDGADQGFIGGYFPDLLDKPLFHPPANGSVVPRNIPDLRLRWNVPCGPNSVITFPGASWLKPWYWWSWPVLPLGIDWHEKRRQHLGYGPEMPMVVIQAILYLGIIAVTRLARPNLTKLCYRGSNDKNIISLLQASIKMLSLWAVLAAYVIPFFIIPCTLHPLLGWSLYLLGSFALTSIAINSFMLPTIHVLMPWMGIFGVLLVMACPWYTNGVVRALSVFAYAFCAAPVVWVSFTKVIASLQVSLEREAFFPKLGDSSTSSSSPRFGLNKLC
ncbi:Putative glucuronosyltransferase PGSIP8 [Linum perenne]